MKINKSRKKNNIKKTCKRGRVERRGIRRKRL